MMFLLVTGAMQAESLDTVPLYRVQDGKVVPFQLKDDTTHVAFYYSASWCPPCRKSTPPLVEEYQRMLDQDGMPVEIALVGSDESEEKMLSYMKKYQMLWPAVVFDARGAVEKYAANGIPHMVLVERDTGVIVAEGTGIGGVEAVVTRMRDFSKVDAAKPFQAENWLSKYGVLIAVGVCFLVILLFQKWREQTK